MTIATQDTSPTEDFSPSSSKPAQVPAHRSKAGKKKFNIYTSAALNELLVVLYDQSPETTF